ncbi:MAG: cytochrome B [Mucilaginibacter sp.]|nr:cytochrome B [Mucilaginibacter sp.]
MTLYSFFLHLHSGLRYIVLLLVLLAILRAWLGWLGNVAYSDSHRKLNLFALISVHTQLLIGLVLYFVSPFVKFGSDTMKDATTRYWTVEHLTGMLIAIALITVGYARSKRGATSDAKHKSIAIFYTLALIVIAIIIIFSKRGLLGMS